ncbi:MAG: Flp pilus assembly protein TadD [Oceanicoccus sp.]|jgi:Flp pilus assembly protein TadD
MSILFLRWGFLLVLAVVFCSVSACVNQPMELDDESINDTLLLEGRPILGQGTFPPFQEHQLLAVNADMLAFLEEHVKPSKNQFTNLEQLLTAIIRNGGFVMTYDGATRSAAETFATRSGNCLSFTNLFIALARELGLNAQYQEIDVPPLWNQQGGSLLLSLHINVLLQMPGRPGRQQIVDFNVENFKSKYERNPISDKRAKAHYYNNLGVEQMHRGNHVASLQFFERGLHFDKRFTPLWNNLGTLYLRNKHHDYAAASYQKAIQIDRDNYVAMSNLMYIQRSRGNTEMVEYLLTRITRHRNRNPYFRYQQAADAFAKGDYDSSITHLNYAVRKKPEEHRFYYLLGVAYLKKGNEDKARNYLERADVAAIDDRVKQEYKRKFETLSQ